MKCYINQGLSHRSKRFTSYTSQFFLRSLVVMLVLVNTFSLNLFASVLNVQLNSTNSTVSSSDICKALIQSVRRGDIATVSTLCNDLRVSKVHINSCVDKWGWGVLHYACSLGSDEAKGMCELLLKQGADVNAVSTSDYIHTPLHKASSENNAEVCELLLSNGANLEAQDSRGETPLHVAARVGSLRSCIVLLKHGANKEALNEGGLTPLDNAIKDRNTEVSDLLSNKKTYDMVKFLNREQAIVHKDRMIAKKKVGEQEIQQRDTDLVFTSTLVCGTMLLLVIVMLLNR